MSEFSFSFEYSLVNVNLIYACTFCPSQEPDSDDCVPRYILLKQEGGEPTLVRRQILSEIPGTERKIYIQIINKDKVGITRYSTPIICCL